MQAYLTLIFLSPNDDADATHIFDGSNQFPTHIAHMRLGSFVTPPTVWPLELPTPRTDAVVSQLNPIPTSLYHVALMWLTEDRNYRHGLEQIGKKTRGAQRNEVGSLSLTGSAMAYSNMCRLHRRTLRPFIRSTWLSL
jgi:hypothetical protein